jgi:hypothetical protein
LEEKSPAYLMVFDALGRVVQQNNLGILSAGIHLKEIALPSNTLGWLYFTLQTTDGSQTIPAFKQ